MRAAVTDPPVRTWPAYWAAAVALLFAAVSFYWGLGGTAGVSTLGGEIERRALAHDSTLFVLVWVTGVLKLLGGLLALALVQPWGRRLPRRPMVAAAGLGAVLLTVYGLLQVGSLALVAAEVVVPDHAVDERSLWWRLLLWEPWFLLWGVLLALTAWSARRPTDRRESGVGG